MTFRVEYLYDAQDPRSECWTFLSLLPGLDNAIILARDGLADVCAIDAVCVAMARRYRPDYLEGLFEIARSPAVPGLPYVTRSGNIDALQTALVAAFANPELEECREQLFLSGHSVLRPNAYERITDLESEMQKAGELELL